MRPLRIQLHADGQSSQEPTYLLLACTRVHFPGEAKRSHTSTLMEASRRYEEYGLQRANKGKIEGIASVVHGEVPGLR